MDISRTIVFIFVFLIINASIYIQLYSIFLKDKKLWQVLAITVVYWLGTVFTENLFPFIAVVTLITRYHLRTENDSRYIRKIDIWEFRWDQVFKTGILTLIFKIGLTFVNSIYVVILNYFIDFDAKPQDVIVNFYQSDLSLKLAMFLLIVIFAPFVEEYVFRYFLYDKFFLSYMPAFYAAILSAAIFTIAHYNAAGVPSFFGLALFCNYIYEKKGYFSAVTVHLVFNLSTLILMIFIKI